MEDIVTEDQKPEPSNVIHGAFSGEVIFNRLYESIPVQVSLRCIEDPLEAP